MIPLKNYTSGVPVSVTVSRIEELLVAIGASDIGKNFDTKTRRLMSITFQMAINGRMLLIRLPANPQAVYDAMKEEVRRPRSGTLERLMVQAERTAWKIQEDWLRVELSNIRLKQKAPLQVFLAYVWDGEQTFYDRLEASSFKPLLLPHKSTAIDA